MVKYCEKCGGHEFSVLAHDYELGGEKQECVSCGNIRVIGEYQEKSIRKR